MATARQNTDEALTNDVTDWAFEALFGRVRSAPDPAGSALTQADSDERTVIAAQALQTCGDRVGYFELHTSDGSIFDVHIGRQGEAPR